MQLSNLLQEIIQIPVEAEREISNLSIDSRAIKAGGLFFAIGGTKVHGKAYIKQAIDHGAVAVLVENDDGQPLTWQAQIPVISINQLPMKIGKIAAKFYDYPAKKLPMIGITGTSGKTSCTQFIAQVLQSLQIRCGLIGTLGNGFYGDLHSSTYTTPDAITLQTILHEIVAAGAALIAMEVSSHSIDQGRINGIDFDIGIFTNLSQDHLDYHHDMASYAAVKHRFIADAPIKNLIINADDAYGLQWINELAAHKSVIAYGTQTLRSSMRPDVSYIFAEKISLSPTGIYAYVNSPWGKREISLPLLGKFNLSNGLAVLSALCVLGIPFETACEQLSLLKTVPGRMQTLGGNGLPIVVVDYAHKPDALEKVLQTLRQQTAGKLYCVFGCGGDRDRSKRPIMAKIAEKWADAVIVTNDNPRHERPEDIAKEILQGFAHPDRVCVELDRSKAIKKSIQWAKVADCVLIAGKGAENYQQIGDKKTPFDDVNEVLKSLNSIFGDA